MKRLTSKIKPTSGFGAVFHIGFTLLLPILLYFLVRLDFVQVALAVILISKWRIFAVRMRHWPANLRANMVDIMVGVSILVFMTHSSTQAWQLVWAVVYALWLIFIKPNSTLFGTSLQAMIGQLFGLSALFIGWGDAPLLALVLGSSFVSYFSARHFYTSFDEVYARLLSYIWSFIAGAMTWVLGHWLLFYGVIAQPTLLLGIVGYSLATIYYLEKTDRLSVLLRRQIVFIMIAIVVVVLTFSEWGDKAI